jgi:glutaredoxin-like protein NrdH
VRFDLTSKKIPLTASQNLIAKLFEQQPVNAWDRFIYIEWEGRMENPVKIYTLSTCSHCKATKKFLDECRVKYEFTDVDLLDGEERVAILKDIKKLNPRCSFPTIVIGDKVIVGYREEEIKEALGL